MRALFLLCCAIIVILAIAAVVWCESRNPIADNPIAEREGPQYYSFTNIEAKPWHRILLIPLVLLAIGDILGTLRRLPK
jgi:hypothetical protein